MFLRRERVQHQREQVTQPAAERKHKDLTYFLQHIRVRAARTANIIGMIMAAYTNALGSLPAHACKDISDIIRIKKKRKKQ